MSTHNICFCREIRKILCGYHLLSVAMKNCFIVNKCFLEDLLTSIFMLILKRFSPALLKSICRVFPDSHFGSLFGTLKS